MLEGRLFFLGKENLTSDDLVLGEVVGGIVAGRLDHVYLIQQLREAAAAQERVRLARDLHDGVLQSFTGIGLRVAALRRLALDAGGPVATRLAELQQLLADEQRDLRFLIQDLESPGVGVEGVAGQLPERLAELATRIEQTWGLRVALTVRDVPEATSSQLVREVYNLVREALVNAARHGGASSVEVDVDARSGAAEWLAITVIDNGRGFPFSGSFSFDQLQAQDLGPRTLRARLAGLGGRLSLDSDSGGARIEMLLPRDAKPRLMPIDIVIADDHPIVLDGLEQLFRLEPDLRVVARCRSGEEALRATREHLPRILVLDVRMPGGTGLEVLAALAQERSPTRVVLLAAALDDGQLAEAVRLGAQGVVLKEMAPQLLLDAVRKVAAGGSGWTRARWAACYAPCSIAKRGKNCRSSPRVNWKWCAWWPADCGTVVSRSASASVRAR
jgi:DNA-binding NarL/FixJ family response regulator